MYVCLCVCVYDLRVCVCVYKIALMGKIYNEMYLRAFT